MHVPFCRAKCRYCDFYSVVADAGALRAYVQGAGRELEATRSCLELPLASVYVGGGTPTAIGAEALRALLVPLAPLVGTDTEFTVEANPGTVDQAVARTLVECGVNRVSLGAQSFDEGELRLLGRIHDPTEIGQAVGLLRGGGIANVGLDLMYAIPGQDLASWRRTLAAAMHLRPEHLSCYALSFEPGTPMERCLREGRIREADESLQKKMYLSAIELATGSGLEHYEISNFARPGRRCRHNLTYWRNGTYLGVGPGAASCVGGVRRTTAPDLPAYLAAVGEGRPPPGTAERLSGRRAMAETLMLGLRLREGADRAEFAERFGQEPQQAFARAFARYGAQGMLLVTPTHVRLVEEAMFVADTILADIVAEA